MGRQGGKREIEVEGRNRGVEREEEIGAVVFMLSWSCSLIPHPPFLSFFNLFFFFQCLKRFKISEEYIVASSLSRS